MKLSPGQCHTTPEYKQALQELIKYEIQALVERLAETGEEAIFVTACSTESTCTMFGSRAGENFLGIQGDLGNRFLSYCTGDKQGGPHHCPRDEDRNGHDSVSLSGDTLSEAAGLNQASLTNFLTATSEPEVSTGVSKEEGIPLKEADLEEVVLKGVEPSGQKGSQSQLYGDRNTKLTSYKTVKLPDVSVLEKSDTSGPCSTVEEVHSQENLLCSVCNKAFSSYESFSLHIRFHAVKSYKCTICGKMSYTKKSHERHLQAHSQCKPFSCRVCDKVFSDSNAWKRHKERHSEMRPYTCQVCGKAFYEKYSLRVHQTSHFPTQRAEKQTDSNTGYSCHSCQKSFLTKCNLKKHLLTHTAKKYSCEFCNKRFAVKFSYVRHRRIHTGEKPYRCQTCAKAFSDSSAWTKHVRTHTGIKPYSCDTCGKAFFDKTTCKVHQKTHEKKKSESFTRKIDYGISDNNDFIEDLTIIMDEKVNSLFDGKEYGDTDLLDSGFENTLLAPHSDVLDYTANSDFLSTTKEPKSSEDGSFTDMSPILDDVHLPDKTFPEDFEHMHLPVNKPHMIYSEDFQDAQAATAVEEVEESSSRGNPEPDVSQLKYKTSLEGEPGRNISSHSSTICDTTPARSVSEKTKLSVMTSIISSIPKCKKCFKAFKTDEELRQHQQFQCLLKFHKCRFCGKRLATKQSLERHVRLHTGEKPFHCNVCQKTFADNSCCIKHVRQHFTNSSQPMSDSTPTVLDNSSEQSTYFNTDSELFKCQFCDKMFVDKLDCEKHVLLHQATNTVCVYRDLSVESPAFKGDKEESRNQLESQNSQPASILSVRNRDGNCSHVAGIELKGDNSTLLAHSPSTLLSVSEDSGLGRSSSSSVVTYEVISPAVTGRYPGLPESLQNKGHGCNVCHKSFKSKGILNQHMLFHKEKKYSCMYCPKKFHNKYGCDRHVRTHTGEKPYSCPVCQKAFSDNSACAKHVRQCNRDKSSVSLA